MNQTKYRPPKIAAWILERIVDPETGYTAMGDFEEQFYLNTEQKGHLYARFVYWFYIIILLMLYSAKSFQLSLNMSKSYFKTAKRVISRQKLYSAINIGGLSAGMACCFLIFLYISEERSCDTFHKNADNIYRVAIDVLFQEETLYSTSSSFAYGPTLKQDYPEVVSFARILKDDPEPVIKIGGDSFVEPGIMTFVYVGILSLVIALLTVLYQSLKAAFANPVNTLKYE